MKWSWKIAEVAGIRVYVHATFFLLIFWVIFNYTTTYGNDLIMTLWGVAFTLALFGCIVLHEFGHALMAKRYGIKTRDITLLPIGGVARLERMPEDPRQELWVALAGPAVNVVIAAILWVGLYLTDSYKPMKDWLSIDHGPFFERLVIVNVFLVVFNMLPAFPMDGGRVVRALLATRMDYARATRIAATLGQGMAFVFGFLGLFGNPFLVIIAIFIWMGAAQEAGMVQMKFALGGVPVERAMLTNFQSLSSHDSLARAMELILTGSQHDFPVVENGHVLGILTRNDLLVALAQQGQNSSVVDVMRRDFIQVDASEMLENIFTRLQGNECRTFPVLRDGRLIGLVTMENIGEFMMIRTALGTQKKH